MSVAIFHGANDLLKQFPGFCFAQPAMLDNVIEQLHRDIFQHHTDFGLCRDDSVQLDYVWMAQELKVLNLSFDAASQVSTDQLAPVDDFHGHLLPGNAVSRELDLAERALSNISYQLVLIQPLYCSRRRRGIRRRGLGQDCPRWRGDERYARS